MQRGKAVGVRHTSLREMAWFRRAFLGAAGGALAGITACRLTGSVDAVSRHPQGGVTLRFATRSDVTSLDLQRHTISALPSMNRLTASHEVFG
jgi:hypothetical protein